LSTTNRIWTGSGSNLGLHNERLVTDHLSHGAAHFRTKIYLTMFKDSVSTFHLSYITKVRHCTCNVAHLCIILCFPSYFTQKQHFYGYFMSSTPVSYTSYKIFLSDYNWILILKAASDSLQHQILWKSIQVEAKLLHVNRQTDGQTWWR
jgi:hypothetical protein